MNSLSNTPDKHNLPQPTYGAYVDPEQTMRLIDQVGQSINPLVVHGSLDTHEAVYDGGWARVCDAEDPASGAEADAFGAPWGSRTMTFPFGPFGARICVPNTAAGPMCIARKLTSAV